MKIRSVTFFVTVEENAFIAPLIHAGIVAKAARDLGPRLGYDVQTTRVAVQPLDVILRQVPAVEFAATFERILLEAGFEYGAFSIESNELLDQAPGILRAGEALFASVRIASQIEGINLLAVQAAAHAIHSLADSTPNGLGNFRFAAAANIPPGVPFFPSAFHDGSAPAFAFATEAADLAVEAFGNARDLDESRDRLIELLETNGASLLKLGEELEYKYGIRFAGIDFSLAPFPEESRSLATALERLTGARFGMRGTLFAAAFITDCLRRAKFKRAGFSGMLLPMMEDWTMARRSKEGLYSLDSLLLYSTVCGTGLDTIPLAGDTSEAAIAALLLDLAALSMKLAKPLTARLIPVPGVREGETTNFSFEYFSNARAFAINADNSMSVFGTKGSVVFSNEI